MKRQYPKKRKSRKSPICPGYRSGKLVVIRNTNTKRRGNWVWECLCDCGNTHLVPTSRLTSGKTKSCGCIVTGGHNKANLVGKKFNRLKVLKESGDRYRREVLWLCECDCGNKTKVTTNKLKSGHTKSCGCLTDEVRSENGLRAVGNLTSPGGPLIYDLVGKKFNRLTVLKKAKRRNLKESTRWICECDCGKIAIVESYSLRNGIVKSCGCYHSDLLRKCPKEDLFLPPSKRISKNLTDGYVRAMITQHKPSLKAIDIPIHLIKLKRQQIIMHRNLKKFKEWREKNEPDHKNV